MTPIRPPVSRRRGAVGYRRNRPFDRGGGRGDDRQIDASRVHEHRRSRPQLRGDVFNGTPLLDGSDDPNTRVTARISDGQQLEYGVQANDEAFRDTIKGLAMLSVIDVDQIDDDATYARWMEAVNDALGQGVEGGVATSTRIGFNLQVVANAQAQLADISLVQQTQIGNYENVDPYEAATMVSSLETQLQASYSVTARLSQLSLLNFL